MDGIRIVKRTPSPVVESQDENVQGEIVQDESTLKQQVLKKKGIKELSEEQEERLLAFVGKQIEKMNSKILFDGKNEPSFYELNMALSTYEQTMFGLIALYESAKYDADIAEERYKEFYAEKYMEVRNAYNNLDVKKGQWLSATEIDSTTRTKFKTELADLKAESVRKNCERSTLERMLKSWESYQFILSQLSKNSIADAQINGLVKYDLSRGDEDMGNI